MNQIIQSKKNQSAKRRGTKLGFDIAELGNQLKDSKFLDKQGNSMKRINSDEHGGHAFHY